MASRARIKWFLFSTGAWCLVLIIVFPLFWIVSTSIKPQSELFNLPPTLVPDDLTLEHYKRLLFETAFPTYFMNSAIVAFGTTATVVAAATLGAYSLVRFRYLGRELGARMVLFTYLLPPVILILPLYILFSWIGIVDTLLSLVVAYSTFALPFALWLLRSFMAGIPPDLESAALIDGASRMRAFCDVILPQLLPGIISTALFTFILAWNEYLYALVLINADSSRTLPPGVINMLTSAYDVEWSLLMAASVMMSGPVIVFFVFLQRHLTRGFGAGAVKG